MTRLLILIVACSLIAGLACVEQRNATPTLFPTPSGPALSVEEYSKACYSAFEKTLNKRGRSPTQEQLLQLIAELQDLAPPRSLEKFHYAYVSGLQQIADVGASLKEWAEADAQIGQMDDETYQAFMERGACGFDEWTVLGSLNSMSVNHGFITRRV